jgi:hypothetical protein
MSIRSSRATRPSRKAARLATVPLLALALAGLTACESDDKSDANGSSSAPASSSPSSSKKDASAEPDSTGKASQGATKSPNGKPSATGRPVTTQQLSDALLTAQEIPEGFTAGDIDTSKDSSPEPQVSKQQCAILIGGGSYEAPVKAEREYESTSLDGDVAAAAGRINIGLASDDPAALKAYFDEYSDAVKACSSFRESDDGKIFEYRIDDVEEGVYGSDSIAFDIVVIQDGQPVAYGHNTMVLKGNLGAGVGAYSEHQLPEPPTTFIRGQLQKLDDLA